MSKREEILKQLQENNEDMIRAKALFLGDEESLKIFSEYSSNEYDNWIEYKNSYSNLVDGVSSSSYIDFEDINVTKNNELNNFLIDNEKGRFNNKNLELIESYKRNLFEKLKFNNISNDDIDDFIKNETKMENVKYYYSYIEEQNKIKDLEDVNPYAYLDDIENDAEYQANLKESEYQEQLEKEILENFINDEDVNVKTKDLTNVELAEKFINGEGVSLEELNNFKTEKERKRDEILKLKISVLSDVSFINENYLNPSNDSYSFEKMIKDNEINLALRDVKNLNKGLKKLESNYQALKLISIEENAFYSIENSIKDIEKTLEDGQKELNKNGQMLIKHPATTGDILHSLAELNDPFWNNLIAHHNEAKKETLVYIANNNNTDLMTLTHLMTNNDKDISKAALNKIHNFESTFNYENMAKDRAEEISEKLNNENFDKWVFKEFEEKQSFIKILNELDITKDIDGNIIEVKRKDGLSFDELENELAKKIEDKNEKITENSDFER